MVEVAAQQTTPGGYAMPKLPKFEDWKAPWETAGTEFDADKARKRIYDLLSDKETSTEKHEAKVAELTEKTTELQKKVDEVESKNLTEAQKLEKEKNDLQEKLSARDKAEEALKTARLEIALDNGLTKAQANRLKGSTEEELKADAAVLLEDLGITVNGKPVERTEETSTSTRRTPATRVRNPLNPGENQDGISVKGLLEAIPRD
jgi:hypothetical protein